MILGALVVAGLALGPPTAPLISGGTYPAELADVLVLYGGGADEEARRRLVALLRTRPRDEHAWAVLLALWWRRPPEPEEIQPALEGAPSVVRDLAGAIWPAETAVGEESKEERLARIAPALSSVVARHPAAPSARSLSCYLRSESEPAAALDACREVLKSDPALLPAARGELFALAALDRTKELDVVLWRYLRSCPEDLGVAWRFFEDVPIPASHAERWSGLAPYLALGGAHPIALRALERLLDDPSRPPFEDGQLRSLLRACSSESGWWIEARPRLIAYLAAHTEHLVDPIVRRFAIDADRTIAKRPLSYPSAEQRAARLLAARALIVEGRAREAQPLLVEIVSRLRPVHRVDFDGLAAAVPPLAIPPLTEWLQPLFDRQGRPALVESDGRPRLVVLTRGECRWTRRLAQEMGGQDVVWISQDAPEMQARALEFLQASGIDAARVLFTRAPGLEPAASVDARLGIEISPDVLLFDAGGLLAYEWEGWPASGMRAALQEQLARLQVAAARSIDGIVVEAATGVPVEGARVVLGPPVGKLAVESGRGGRFHLDRAPSGGVTLEASKPGIGWGRERVSASASGEAIVRLHPVGSIVGQVSLADGVSPGVVRVPGPGRRATIGEDGRFRLEEVPSGEARVEWVRSEGEGRASVRVASVEVRAGEETEAAFSDGSSVAGRVTLRGSPVPGARISWVRWEGERPGGNLPTGLATAMTGEDGSYALAGLEPGHYTVSARIERVGALREALLVEGAEQTFDVALSGDIVEGTVVDAATSAPIAGAQLFAYDPARTFAPVSRSWSIDDESTQQVAQASGSLGVATSDADGRFELLVEPHASAVEARARGYLSSTAGIDPRDPDAAAEPIRLRRAAALRGVLLDDRGEPASGGRVFVRYGAGSEAFAIAREDGGFAFESVPAGPFDLVAARGERLAVVHGVAAPDDPAISVTLAGGGGLELRGAVPAGTPGAGALPRVVDPSGCDVVDLLARADDARVMPRLQPAKEGWTLRLPLVPAGSYLLQTQAPKAIAARVAPSEVTAVDLRFP